MVEKTTYLIIIPIKLNFYKFWYQPLKGLWNVVVYLVCNSMYVQLKRIQVEGS